MPVFLPNLQSAFRPAREPKASYEVVIVGAGGHGLALAHYLANEHGVTDVGVLERGLLGGGNMTRNTAVVRSNYLFEASIGIYEHSLTLWEGLAEELEADIGFRQIGVLTLAHSLGDVRQSMRRVNANRLSGTDAEWLRPDAVKELCPVINVDPDVRYPVHGATLQRRAGVARHDDVAWAFARSADVAGVDVVEGCEVTGFEVEADRVTVVQTNVGPIAAGTVVLCAAGHTSVLTEPLGFKLPLQSHPLQALVSELLHEVLPCVVMSNAVHVYVSQADKGELVLGAGIDAYNSYSQRGTFSVIEGMMAATVELFPIFATAHLLRSWAGVVDVTPDASPIVGPSPIEGLYLNCGWGTGGFKATPGLGQTLAATVATGVVDERLLPFSAERFETGELIDEHGAAGVAH
jgi:sarcosine oxidase subunit beta